MDKYIKITVCVDLTVLKEYGQIDLDEVKVQHFVAMEESARTQDIEVLAFNCGTIDLRDFFKSDEWKNFSNGISIGEKCKLMSYLCDIMQYNWEIITREEYEEGLKDD